ncbi:MAG: GNAT family N-acetyltransferase [Alphaproteobacteria bacterium]|nr:GNAT family N-acetyltransferase [Alphaproteobacteria bacterium]
MPFDIRPADWEGFASVMGEKGGCGGCWCMLWRLPKKQMDAQMGAANRAAMKALFDGGAVPGLVAYDGDTPAGWIQIAPRSDFVRLETARVLKPVDAVPVWSIACFLVAKPYRRQGLSVALLEAACAFAQSRGAEIVEGYPIDTDKDKYPPVYAWTGFAGAFREAGFEEVARRSPTRPILRKVLTAS